MTTPKSKIPYRPHRGQIAFHESRARFRAFFCGRRYGKDFATLQEASRLLQAWLPRRRAEHLVPRVHAWFVGPDYPRSRDWERRFIRTWPYDFQHNKAERILYLPNDTVLEFKSADNPDSLVGVGLDLLVTTECHQIPDPAYRSSLRPTLDSPGRYGVGLYTGLPGTMGWIEDFKRAADDGNQSFFYINEPSWQNPHISRESLEAAHAELPQSVWDREYGAVWPKGEGSVFRRILETCCIPVEGEPPYFAEYEGGPVFDGLDLARKEDWMVYWAFELKKDGVLRQVAFDRFNREDWRLQIERVAAHAKRYWNRSGYFDATGIGDAVAPLLDDAGVDFDPYTFSNPSKSQLVSALSAAMDHGRCQFFNLPVIRDEFRRFSYTLTKQGNYVYSAPEGHHDDCVFGAALAIWAAQSSVPTMTAAESRAFATAVLS
jgi:hypothetical protein